MSSKSNEKTTAASGSEHVAAVGNFNDAQTCDIESAKAQLPISNTHRDAIEDIITKIKTAYERKLSETLKMHDEMARKCDKLQMDFKRLQDDSKDLQSELKKKTKDLETAERNAMICKTRCTNLQLQLDESQAEMNKMLAKKDRDSKKEIDRLQALLNESQTQKMDKIFELEDLRDRNKEQMRANREEIKLQYENKIKNMAKKLRKKRKPTCYVELEKPEWTKMELQPEILENIIRGLKAKGEQYVRMKVNISDAPKLFRSTELPKLQIDIKRLCHDNEDLKSKSSSSSSSSSDDSDESSSDESSSDESSWTRLSWPPIISLSSSSSLWSPSSSPPSSSSTSSPTPSSLWSPSSWLSSPSSSSPSSSSPSSSSLSRTWM